MTNEKPCSQREKKRGGENANTLSLRRNAKVIGKGPQTSAFDNPNGSIGKDGVQVKRCGSRSEGWQGGLIISPTFSPSSPSAMFPTSWEESFITSPDLKKNALGNLKMIGGKQPNTNRSVVFALTSSGCGVCPVNLM